MVITVNLGSASLKTTSGWEDFLRSFERHLEKIDSARRLLVSSVPENQVDSLLASNSQLAEAIEAEHRRLTRTILCESEIEFEPDSSSAEAEEFMPSVELIEAKTGELMEELDGLKRDCRAKKGQLDELTVEREQLAARYAAVKRERQQYLNKMLA